MKSYLTLMSCTGLADSHRHAKDSVGAQLVLVVSAVKLQHHLVNLLLFNRVTGSLDKLRGDDVVHVVNSLERYRDHNI